jgi:peptidoglycan/xylan/chitin deacetylase (PgdA/CDA1 family)
MNSGKFVISLDFELYWGVRDSKSLDQYGENIKGVHRVIPKMLDLFSKYNICATFSTVGLLFFENKRALLAGLPDKVPAYTNQALSPYNGYFEKIGNDAEDDPYHYAPHLIRLIQKSPGQEIGSHTFSHYYCLEEGQTVEAFKADGIAAKKIAQQFDITLTSLVFPRNQFNNEYLAACKELGIICYRGNERSWLYKAKPSKKQHLFQRLIRLADAYINISGQNCYPDEYMKGGDPVNIPASRFLRPYSKKLKFFDAMKLRRIRSGMTYAAKNNLTYHLWWHPHNFGINQDKNFSLLEKILDHYQELRNKYNFENYTMSGLANKLRTSI